MTLEHLGWNARFATHFEALSLPHTTPGRVVRQDSHHYQVATAAGTHTAILPGRFRHDEALERPAVGDWVALETPDTGDLAVIQAVLPRRSAFSRKVAGTTTREQVIAANLDVVFLMTALDGDFNLRRIERYVTQAWNSGAAPVLLLNKADACDDVAGRRLAAEAAAPGVEVHVLSALRGDGLDPVRGYLTPGTTAALVGSSGVGKSTLINRLLGRERMRTAAVREDDSRGRHTTTHRELLVVPGGGLLIDTPGLREVQLWTDEAGLEGSFSEVETLAADCHFRDCTHRHEPGCAVRMAVEDGRFDAGRYQSYLKLQDELAYLERRQAESGRLEEKRRGKEGARRVREVNRYHPKRRGRDL